MTIITLKETATTGDNSFQIDLSFDHDTSYPLTITRPPAPSESDLEAIPNTLSEAENALLQWRSYTIMNAEISFEGIKVVVIDDSKTTRRIVEVLLTKAGCKVITATDGFESLAKVIEHQPNIIFVDLMMPRLDGFQTCALIKNHPAFKKIPVVMLSGVDSLRHRAYSRIVGFDHYMTKPLSREELFSVIKTYVVDAKKAGERMTETPTQNRREVAELLETALQENGPAFIMETLGDIARAKMTQIAGDTGLDGDSLQALSSGSHIELATVLKVVQALGLKLHTGVISN